MTNYGKPITPLTVTTELDLLIEAKRVYYETGLWPREVRDERDELRSCIKAIYYQAMAQFAVGDKHATFNKQQIAILGHALSNTKVKHEGA